MSETVKSNYYDAQTLIALWFYGEIREKGERGREQRRVRQGGKRGGRTQVRTELMRQ